MKQLLTFFCIAFFYTLSSKADIKQFYVSSKGNDLKSGTKELPLKTFQGALDKIKVYRKEHPTTKIEVLFKAGYYPIKKTLLITPDIAGKKGTPILFKAIEKNASPIFTGSVTIKGWKKLTDKKTLKKLDPSVKNKIYVCKISRKIKSLGTPIIYGLYDAFTPEGEKRTEDYRLDFICDTTIQKLAQWPNHGFTKARKVLKNNEDTVRFEYRDKRIDKWSKEKEACLSGYWYWDWCDEFHYVKNIKTSDSTIMIKPPFHSRGYRDNFRFKGINLFCELDEPGEYYLDRTTRQLYWYPPKNTNPKKVETRITLLNQHFMLKIIDCSNITLQGLTFRESRDSGIKLEGGENNKIDDCCLLRFGNQGINIIGGKRHRVSRCFLQDFGGRIMEIVAGNRKELISANHLITNNVMERFSLFKHTYQPAIYFEGIGLTISHNRFRHCPSSALRLDGNDVIVEYNDFIDLVEESDDQGAIDVWNNISYRGIVIRYNYWQDITGGTKNGAAAVRFDDAISGQEVYGNIFNHSGSVLFGAVQIHGGKDNIIYNNLFYNCRASVSFTPWSKKFWDSFINRERTQNLLFKEVNIHSEKYLKKYPLLKKYKQHTNKNKVYNNVVINCKSQYLRENKQNFVSDNLVIPKTKKSLSWFIQSENLRQLNLSIPTKEIGIKENRWTKQKTMLTHPK